MTSMDYSICKANLDRNHALVASNAGPALFMIVTGSESDFKYWNDRLEMTKSELFRKDNSTRILSVLEGAPKGNFLGTLNAWQRFIESNLYDEAIKTKDVILTSMVFGKGTRLSPFTQVLNNCKSRLPTPDFVGKGTYLNIGELSNLYSNLLVDHLRSSNFRGMVVKWGDEIVLPGTSWDPRAMDLGDTDAVRFIWYTEPTPDLAREKEWMLVDIHTGTMKSQFARQDMSRLMERARLATMPDHRLGVNLGSLAISYDFLDQAATVFADDVRNPLRALDWDPYVWVALSCNLEDEWRNEIDLESRIGGSGLAKLEKQYPDFFKKIQVVKNKVEDKKGRQFSIKALDYGDVFWTDFGQHIAFRKTLCSILSPTDQGNLTRDLFSLPQARDARGNTILNSEIHPDADIRNSVILNSKIASGSSQVDGGIIIGCNHDRVIMPQGGVSLFSTTQESYFVGPNAISFCSIVNSLHLPEGGRHSTLILPGKIYQLVANESVLDYKGESFENPILDNPISFGEASRLINAIDLETVEKLRGDAELNVTSM
jgi:hypothetical protein